MKIDAGSDRQTWDEEKGKSFTDANSVPCDFIFDSFLPLILCFSDSLFSSLLLPELKRTRSLVLNRLGEQKIRTKSLYDATSRQLMSSSPYMASISSLLC